ncbi:hypothetical protein PPO43_04285 [Saprospira sp. CCB-QB6]|uniref:hypothetical protein n=1 Tax=Saprospira sp. CCB-QB6 TaxID=3023936 RepID=UPI0023491853|nr:hypothetical protein [Saprospira sp. CCB-QB6]WCL82318.1 hypothetical protein PPO43_04285 [Saprospira sp. CCB-QB6]
MYLKRWSVLALLLCFGLLTNSCDNEVDVVGDWKEVPVVYGVINPLPLFEPMEPHYIRIEKAFLDPRTDAFQIAQRPDSLYYGPFDLEVILFQQSLQGSQVISTALDTLERVSAVDEGFGDREEGIFAASPNYIYKSDAVVPVGAYLMLKVKNLSSGKEYDIYTKAIQAGDLDLTGQTFRNFRVNTPSTSLGVKWVNYDQGSQDWIFRDINFNWATPTDAAVYDLSLDIHYYEFEVDESQTGEPEIAGTRVLKTLTWTPFRSIMASGSSEPKGLCSACPATYERFVEGDGSVAQEINGENFFRYLASNLSSTTDNNIRRCFSHFDVQVDAAGVDLANYLKANAANQTLVGGLFPAEPYTNVPDGYGIFTTKMFTNKKGYDLDDEVLEYLKFGEITRDLGFRDYSCN